MAALFLGVVLLGLGLLLLRWFVDAEPRAVLKAFKWTGIALVAGVLLLLVASGRLGWALAGVAGLAPWVVRAIRVHAMARHLHGFAKFFGSVNPGTFGPGAQPSSGRVSSVNTAFLRVTLDHDTGRMSGRVVAGALAGQRLEDLTFEAAMALHREVAGDEESMRVLEAWLDRGGPPDWRTRAAGQQRAGTGAGHGGGRPGDMTRDDAYRVLGLEPGASEADVRQSYRRLMAKMHPDAGGSSYLAAQINRAKDLLLK